MHCDFLKIKCLPVILYVPPIALDTLISRCCRSLNAVVVLQHSLLRLLMKIALHTTKNENIYEMENTQFFNYLYKCQNNSILDFFLPVTNMLLTCEHKRINWIFFPRPLCEGCKAGLEKKGRRPQMNVGAFISGGGGDVLGKMPFRRFEP